MCLGPTRQLMKEKQMLLARALATMMICQMISGMVPVKSFQSRLAYLAIETTYLGDGGGGLGGTGGLGGGGLNDETH